MSMKRKAFWKRAFLTGLLVIAFSINPATGAFSQSKGAQSKLDDNLKKWSSVKKADYRYTFQLTCFCPQDITLPVRVSVSGGEVREVRYVRSGEQADITKFEYYLKIERLFEIIQDAIDRGADRIDVSYHAEFGYPKSVYIDQKVTMVDEEIRLKVQDLVIGK